MDNGPQQTVQALDLYRSAKCYLMKNGFESELRWQESLNPGKFSETDLLRESAWVVLCSGFRESIVRRDFQKISLCFFDWESATLICEYRSHCRAAALSRFKNKKKIDAIIGIAEHVAEIGFDQFKEWVLADPMSTLQIFPFIGAITVFHLAKNLGLSVAKPDRHLRRIALTFGYEDVGRLCKDISSANGDSVKLVDIVLWRYSERNATTLRRTTEPRCGPVV